MSNLYWKNIPYESLVFLHNLWTETLRTLLYTNFTKILYWSALDIEKVSPTGTNRRYTNLLSSILNIIFLSLWSTGWCAYWPLYKIYISCAQGSSLVTQPTVCTCFTFLASCRNYGSGDKNKKMLTLSNATSMGYFCCNPLALTWNLQVFYQTRKCHSNYSNWWDPSRFLTTCLSKIN